MKIKQIYISDENFDKLKGINASKLINDMLDDHFKNIDLTKLSKEEVEKRIVLLEEKLRIEKELTNGSN
jgi:hypothetical protein